MTVTVHVPVKKKDIESAYDKDRRPWECKCSANFLLIIVALFVVVLGAGSFNRRFVFGKQEQVATITNLTQVEKIIVYYPVILGVPVPVVGVSPSSLPDAARPKVVAPTNLLNWPSIFQREGWMLVYDRPTPGDRKLRCTFPEARNSTEFSAPVGIGKCYEYESESDSEDPPRDRVLEDAQAPMARSLKNFTEWSDVKLLPLKRPESSVQFGMVVTIKMPLLDMSYSDHTKTCLSFCALHPNCLSCSAFPDAPMRVNRHLDLIIGPVDLDAGPKNTRTLSCLLFLITQHAHHVTQSHEASYGAMSYVDAEAQTTNA